MRNELPICCTRSNWLCTLERPGPEEDLCVRLGLRHAGGLREKVANELVAVRDESPFRSVGDLAARVAIRREELAALAELGALASLPLRPGEPAGPRVTRRAALWQAEAAARRGPGLFTEVEPRDDSEGAHVEVETEALAPARLSPLREMTAPERTAADLRNSGITVGPHPIAHARPRLRAFGALTAAELQTAPAGRRVRCGGLCIVRQRPGTAKGFVFLSLEDETGISNVIIEPPVYEQNRRAILASALIAVEGRLERRDGVTNLKADRFWPLAGLGDDVRGRDFH